MSLLFVYVWCLLCKIFSSLLFVYVWLGVIQVLRNTMRGVCIRISVEQRYEGVSSKVISVTRGCGGVQFPGENVP